MNDKPQGFLKKVNDEFIQLEKTFDKIDRKVAYFWHEEALVANFRPLSTVWMLDIIWWKNIKTKIKKELSIMLIIGAIGPIGSGKDTILQIILRLLTLK